MGRVARLETERYSNPEHECPMCGKEAFQRRRGRQWTQLERSPDGGNARLGNPMDPR